MRYWKTKTFKTKEAMQAWINKYGKTNQWEEVFINNGYCIEYKPMKVIKFK